MQDKNKIKEEAGLLSTLRLLVESYEEISVLRMQRVKSSVLLTRDFLERLSQVFLDVRSNYQREIASITRQKKNADKESFSTIKKNGRTVSVFLSSNSKFYGDIIQKVFQEFINDIKKKDSDIVIVGRIGRQLYEQSGVKKQYQYFELPDSQVAVEDLRSLVSHIIQYENVDVYHGKYSNMVTQLATMSNVSGDQIVEEQVTTDRKFFFEPDLEKILNFFETQVFSSLFKQTVNESELSRLAARIKAMEEAFDNIDRTENSLGMRFRKVKRYEQNKRQLESLTGVYFWSTHFK